MEPGVVVNIRILISGYKNNHISPAKVQLFSENEAFVPKNCN